MRQKSSLEEIKGRFDNEVEKFSNMETSQQAIIDGELAMELITKAAVATNPKAKKLLDIGCGAGNLSLKLLQYLSNSDCDLLDISQGMLEKAYERVSWATTGKVQMVQEDIRAADLIPNNYNIIVAATVLHHLRSKKEWEMTFTKIYDLLAPGGSFWITDLVAHENPAVQDMMWKMYGEYLASMGGESFRDKIFNCIEKEDSPRSLSFQLNLMQEVGFVDVEILHKNICYATFGGRKK